VKGRDKSVKYYGAGVVYDDPQPGSYKVVYAADYDKLFGANERLKAKLKWLEDNWGRFNIIRTSEGFHSDTVARAGTLEDLVEQHMRGSDDG
jgi:hypothetical protein